MRPHRAALLTLLACLLAAAPATASERSEARKYAAAMQPQIELTPEEGEALVAGYEANAAHVAATCLPAVKAAASKRDRVFVLTFVYGAHISITSYGHLKRWMGEADARLAAIRTRSRTLRRGRAARASITAFYGKLEAAAPVDFCAAVTGWQANGWKDVPPGTETLIGLLEEGGLGSVRIRRGKQVLRRHGATRAQLRAFDGTPRWPELREPAPDPVIEAITGDDAPATVSPW